MEEEIQLGRITRAVEKSLNLSLTSDVRVYGKQKYLDDLAEKYPNSYLAMLEEVRNNALKMPDFVYFDEAKQEFRMIKIYCKNGIFSFWEVLLVHEGSPKKWYFASFGPYEIKMKRPFVRVGK